MQLAVKGLQEQFALELAELRKKVGHNIPNLARAYLMCMFCQVNLFFRLLWMFSVGGIWEENLQVGRVRLRQVLSFGRRWNYGRWLVVGKKRYMSNMLLSCKFCHSKMKIWRFLTISCHSTHLPPNKDSFIFLFSNKAVLASTHWAHIV